jgi:hypothetical protein
MSTRQKPHRRLLQQQSVASLVDALAVGNPLEDVGGLMASLNSDHLSLVLAVLRMPAAAVGLDGL